MDNKTLLAIFKLTDQKVRTKGWWGGGSGHGLTGGRQYVYPRSTSAQANCKCVGFAMQDAIMDVLGTPTVTIAIQNEVYDTFLSVINADIYGGEFDHVWYIAAWNDKPKRHFATIKRALARAIAKVDTPSANSDYLAA